MHFSKFFHTFPSVIPPIKYPISLMLPAPPPTIAILIRINEKPVATRVISDCGGGGWPNFLVARRLNELFGGMNKRKPPAIPPP